MHDYLTTCSLVHVHVHLGLGKTFSCLPTNVNAVATQCMVPVSSVHIYIHALCMLKFLKPNISQSPKVYSVECGLFHNNQLFSFYV